MKAKKKNSKQHRWNLRLPAELSDWAKAYSQEHHTTVTRLIVEYFDELKKRSETGFVEQV